jgi:CRP-like cAMP-binding protein
MPSNTEQAPRSHPPLAAAEPSGDAGYPAPALTELRNRLLRALPPQELARLRPYLEPVSIAALQELVEADGPLTHAYFPETAVISAVRRTRDGAAIEAGTVGREGMVGLAVLLGDPWSPEALIAQVPGLCLRIPFERLRGLLPELPTLSALLRRSALAFMDHLAQAVLCNGLHSVERRCARWLLAAHDRVDGDTFQLTHEALARVLAVRRAGVTEAALALQRAGLIAYGRGRVTIVDRAGLEAAACECYGVERANFERLLAFPGRATRDA